MPSPPAALVDWCQVISAVLGLIALVVALFAVAKAKRDLVTERRIIYELDVLLGIADALRSFGGPSLVQLMRTHLSILPGDRDLPIARAEFDVRGSVQAKRRLAAMKESAPQSKMTRYHAGQEFLDLYRRELDEAIARRVERRAGRPVKN